MGKQINTPWSLSKESWGWQIEAPCDSVNGSWARAPLPPHVPPWSLKLPGSQLQKVHWWRNHRPKKAKPVDRLVLIPGCPCQGGDGKQKERIQRETSCEESEDRWHRGAWLCPELSPQPEWSMCLAEWSPRAVCVLGAGDPGTRNSRWTDRGVDGICLHTALY